MLFPYTPRIQTQSVKDLWFSTGLDICIKVPLSQKSPKTTTIDMHSSQEDMQKKERSL
jgi:hypothetical protein